MPAIPDFALTWLERMPRRFPAADLTPWPPASPRSADDDSVPDAWGPRSSGDGRRPAAEAPVNTSEAHGLAAAG